MFGNIGKEFVELTGRPFARVVAYAAGLGVIVLFFGQLLYLFNQLLDAVEGADPRAALQSIALSTALTVVSLFIFHRLINRWNRRGVEAIEQVRDRVRTQRARVKSLLDLVETRYSELDEYRKAGDRARKESEEVLARAEEVQGSTAILVAQIKSLMVRMRGFLRGLREKGLLEGEYEFLDDDDKWPDDADGS